MTESENQLDSTPPKTPSASPVSNGASPPESASAARLVMRLFLVPLIIVMIIVMVWLMFGWLAQKGSRPEEMVQDIERLNSSSWAKAYQLARRLRDSRNSALRHDRLLAQRMADLLDEQLEEGQLDKNRLQLRLYLARALGEFQVTNGVPVLVRAVRTERDSSEVDIRRAALQAIGRMTETVGAPLLVQENTDLLPALVEAASSRNKDPSERQLRGRLRSTATFVLGLFPDAVARQQLVVNLTDAYPDVRYNAAIGLARQGDERAVGGLLEMLDPQSVHVIESEGSQTEQQSKRIHVMKNALRAAGQLAENRSPQADLSELIQAIEQLRINNELDWLRWLHVEMDQSLQRLRNVADRSAGRFLPQGKGPS